MKKILLVEDERPLGENISLLLRNEGYEVVYAKDGLDALHQLEGFTPDLIISDIMMPVVNGYELFQTVKKNDRIKFVPFLFLTAKSDILSIRQGMSMGADDYIVKPFSSADLLSTINIRLQKASLINAQIDEIRDSISKYVPHELRTPLVAILGYSQIILNEYETMNKSEIIDMVERINVGAGRLHGRIEKFLQLTDLEPVNKDIWFGEARETLINDATVIEIIESHHNISKRKNDISYKISPAQLRIPERYLKSVINEILENAVKFSLAGKPITIKGAKKGNLYILKIRDHGIGMNPEELNHIGAFKQFGREVLQQEGNGLGLVFVKKVMQTIKGELKIHSRDQQFTEIELNIPLA